MKRTETTTLMTRALLTAVLAVVIGSVRLVSEPGSSEWTVVNAHNRNVSDVHRDWRGDWRTAVTDRLTGSYRLDRDRSGDPRATAGRAPRDWAGGDQQRLRRAIARQVEPPDSLSIERDGRTVTIASPQARSVTFEADGREQTERSRNGGSMRTIATLSGDRLVITTEGDQSSDYQVTFEPTDDGRRLRVTRRVMHEDLRQAVVTYSIYDKTSDAPQRDVLPGDGDGYASGETSSGRVIVTAGTARFGHP